MQDSVYLIVGMDGVRRMRKGAPSLLKGEIVIKVNVKIPDSIFKAPLFEAEINAENGFDQDLEIEMLEKQINAIKTKGD